MVGRSTLKHYFTPHHTNNFRAKLLHNSGIFLFIGIFLTANLLIRLLDATPLHILGFTSSITTSEVVTATNNARLTAGLTPLTYSETLADAARRKAADMFADNYWAHNSPSGETPWNWFKAAGYSYLYAGENLAKDFGSTDRMLSAWMASPTHRDNIVSDKYKELGVAVVPGVLQGSETVLVVQLFGTPSTGTVPQTQASSNQITAAPAATPAPTIIPAATPAPVLATVGEDSVQALVAEVKSAPKLSEYNVKRFVSIAMTLLFMLALIVDLILAENQVLSRRVGKNWAHLIFINVVLLATTLVSAGSIM